MIPPKRIKVAIVSVASVFLLTLAVVAWGGGHGGDAHDKAKNASAGDPDGVSETTEPLIGTADPKAQLISDTITPDVGKKMLGEFLRAQSSEFKATKHRQELELKELKVSQTARQKEWEKHEQDARHKFFAENHRGQDRRAYIGDFMRRHRDFLQSLTDERNQKLRDQDARLVSQKKDQTSRLKEFEASLNRNQRPAASLWPGSN